MKIHSGLVKGSFVLLVVFGIYGFLNFIFQASMARLLSVSDYGVLAFLFYFVYILSIFAESIQTVFSKQTSLEKNDEKLKNIINRALKKIFFASFLIYGFYLILMFPFSIYRKIPYGLFVLTGLFIFSSLPLPVMRGVMQGRKKFIGLGANLIVESLVKLCLAISFVAIGWKIYGAVGGALLGTFAALFYSFFGIKDFRKIKEKKAETVEIKKDSKYVFMITFSLLAFYITDIFIAQLVFDKETAGVYAIASVLGKAIFWGTQPIGRAMFPLATEKGENKKLNHNIYYNALAILSMVTICALILFYFLPSQIISIFAGKEIAKSANILFYLGIANTLLSFANLNILYKISKRVPEKKEIFYFLAFLLIGIILLVVFNDSLLKFSLAFIASSSLFLWGSIVLMKE